MICIRRLPLARVAAVTHLSRMTDPFRPVDDDARATMDRLLAKMRHGVLSYLDPKRATPSASRIALLCLPGHGLVTLVSELSLHTPALQSGAKCALLVGEPAAKGDALTAPRVTLHAQPKPIDKSTIRDAWLTHLPKSALYFDFTDFIAFDFGLDDAFLNGGFGKAFLFTPDDLRPYAS